MKEFAETNLFWFTSASTINLPKEATVEDVYNIYFNAWKYGLKGVTVYRSGCLREGILTVENEKKEDNTFKDVKAPKRPKELKADLHLVKARGQQFIVLVGILNNRPYEVWAFRPNMTVKLEPHSGIITKKAKKKYSFKSDLIEIADLQLKNEDIEENIFDYIKKTPEFSFCKDKEFSKIEIYLDET